MSIIPQFSQLSPPTFPPQAGAYDGMPRKDSTTRLQKDQIHCLNFTKEINRLIRLKRKTWRVPPMEPKGGLTDKLWRDIKKKKKPNYNVQWEAAESKSDTKQGRTNTSVLVLRVWREAGPNERVLPGHTDKPLSKQSVLYHPHLMDGRRYTSKQFSFSSNPSPKKRKMWYCHPGFSRFHQTRLPSRMAR